MQETLDSRVNGGDWVITPEDLPPVAQPKNQDGLAIGLARACVGTLPQERRIKWTTTRNNNGNLGFFSGQVQL